MQFVNEYTTSRKYEPNDILVVVWYQREKGLLSSGQLCGAAYRSPAEDQGMRDTSCCTRKGRCNDDRCSGRD